MPDKLLQPDHHHRFIVYLVKGLANVLSKSTLTKFLRSFVAQSTRHLVQLIIGNHRIFLESFLPIQES